VPSCISSACSDAPIIVLKKPILLRDEGDVLRPPTTSFRWSTAERRVIAFGIELTCYYGSDLDPSARDSETALAINQLAKAVREIARRTPGTHRVRLDATQIAICRFAIRSFDREIRRGQLPQPGLADGQQQGKPAQDTRETPKTRRAEVASVRGSQYQELSRRWRRFLGLKVYGFGPARACISVVNKFGFSAGANPGLTDNAGSGKN
jgi:hypothetical protein